MSDFWFYFSKYAGVGEKNKIMQFLCAICSFFGSAFFCDKGSSKYSVTS